jgi:lipopolysaccharide/colanic/teichoic acid biosynthesis glycosyltransferase
MPPTTSPISVQAAGLVAPRRWRARATAASCRALDVLVASVLLVALLPVMLAIAIAIRIDSPGPAVFRQRRLGRHLKAFTVNKFRTMRTGVTADVHRAYVLGLITRDAEQPADGGRLYKLTVDQRVTRLGRWLRKTSLDELPQLWNVLTGSMSLVGPRPSLAYEVERYPKDWYLRFEVKPGLTGLWQVSGRNRLTWEQMIRLDEEYVRRRSLRLNLWILLQTVPTVLLARDAA